MPKVSICVVTYNQEKYIKTCLESIITQEANFVFEIIVSDDHSNDNTTEIIKEYAEKYNFIRQIKRDKNVGPYRNFIETHNAATGEYVCHVDGDDYWLPGKLQYQADILDRDKSLTQCWTFAKIVTDNGEEKNVFPSRLSRIVYPSRITSKKIALSYCLVGHHSTQMYRRACRDFIDPQKVMLDYKVAFMISLSGNGFYSKKILSAYRVTENPSITRSESKTKPTVDVLSDHLVDIILNNPQCGKEAKANLVTRKIFSMLRKHDLKKINENIKKVKKTKVDIRLVVLSSYYFLVQKLKL